MHVWGPTISPKPLDNDSLAPQPGFAIDAKRTPDSRFFRLESFQKIRSNFRDAQ